MARRDDSLETIQALAEVLEADRGCVGDGLDFSQGFPKQFPPDAKGFYGKHGAVVLQVYPRGTPGEVTAYATAQSQIRQSEVVQALETRIAEKDHPPNDLLLLTCGLPDAKGYTCPLDNFLFLCVSEAMKAGALSLAPKHLSGIALHQWDSPNWLQLYRGDTALTPWLDR